MIGSFLTVLHIISFVSWLGGLFYLVNVFVYHRKILETKETSPSATLILLGRIERGVYKKMCTPGMILSWVSGIFLILINGIEWLQDNDWMLQKILLLVLLTVFHLMTNREIKKLSYQLHHMTTAQFKLYNLIPVLFLLAIVIISIFKNEHTVVNPVVVIGMASALLFIFARINHPKYLRIKIKSNDQD